MSSISFWSEATQRRNSNAGETRAGEYGQWPIEQSGVTRETRTLPYGQCFRNCVNHENVNLEMTTDI